MEDRIKLAEAMGWQRRSHDFGGDTWLPPGVDDGTWENPEIFQTDRLPNPFEDANDANALVVYLTQKGYEVHIMWPSKDRKALKGKVKLYKNGFRTCEYFIQEMFGDALSRATLKVLEHE